MTTNMIRIICVLIAVMSISAQDVDEQYISSADSFTADIYQKVTAEVQGNAMISPASIQSAVALTMFGASGQTKTEMLQGLKYPSQYSMNSISDGFKAFNNYVEQATSLKNANKIYIMKGFTVKPTFQEIAKKSFKSEAQDLDFEQSTKAADVINRWVAGQTDNHITEIVDSDSLDEDTKIVVVNAIYFKGIWKYKFEKDLTTKAPFYLNEVDSVQTDFMKMTKDFKYAYVDDIDATVVELPYGGTDITMMIILPNSRTGLSGLERNLKKVNFKDIAEEMYSQKVNLQMPKFKFEFEANLNQALIKMGMKKMFSNKADFEDMLTQSGDLKVSEFIHKAFIEVDEEGTRAAASTRGRNKSPKIASSTAPMIIDHPFLFVLRSPTTTFFIGRVVKF